VPKKFLLPYSNFILKFYLRNSYPKWVQLKLDGTELDHKDMNNI
jgi:hypothetical protein